MTLTISATELAANLFGGARAREGLRRRRPGRDRVGGACQGRPLAYVIDSSFAIDLERRRGSITELRDRFGDVGMVIATITLFELLVGMHRANDHGRRVRRQEHLDRLVVLVTVLPFDDEVARRHARITAELTACLLYTSPSPRDS